MFRRHQAKIGGQPPRPLSATAKQIVALCTSKRRSHVIPRPSPLLSRLPLEPG
jgi:hypothetical protein